MAVEFTPAQKSVIDTRDRNILVSAAAGSGKTAVLVERIIQKICDEVHPVDVDRLLIVTFTHAAAAQMKERINKAISKKLDENPLNEHLQRQAALIHNAQITTIDSFCLFVMRNNFNAIGIDPGFRVADEAEIKMIKADVLKNLLEEKYTLKEESFLKFVECYSAKADEKQIEDAIEKLFTFSQSYPFPEDWLNERRLDYFAENEEDLSNSKWFKKANEYKNNVVCDCINQINKAINIASLPTGPDQYLENLEDDLKILGKLIDCKTYSQCFDAFKHIEFSSLSRKKGTEVDASLKETTKGIRDDVKKKINDISVKLFSFSLEDTLRDMAECTSIVNELIDLTLAYKECVDKQKRDKNIADFSDIEHFALQILVNKDEDGNIVATETAKELRDYFEEIMIDEYQDSNEVQELLLKSISKEEDGVFNRFMVGDVKQSIYKFRLARPEIFMDKYNTYIPDCTKEGSVRIDLSKNFRSREEITGITNFICGQIMEKAVGNVEYDKAAELNHGATDAPVDENNNPYRTELLLATNDKLEESDEEDLEGAELEATMVADRINEIIKGEFKVTDDDSHELRPASFSDIVILFRAVSGVGETYRKVLNEKGIPVHLVSKTGYFETLEIQSILNVLRVLDNPTLDIPFLGTMKFPYFGFSDTDIAKIKCAVESKEKMSLYNRTLEYRFLENAEEDLLEKVERLLNTIEKYREKKAYTPIKELIGEILDETGYLSYVSALPAGTQRRANLELLLEKAGDFEKTSFYGLFHFIRYIETIKEREVDFGEANILDEKANVVRIMTIHNSKGLEFPICFVSGMSKQFNLMDTRNAIISDVELGIGVDYIDPKNRIKRKTSRKNLVSLFMQQDTKGEELRVLYVALTRAKEKLILTGQVKSLEASIKNNYSYMLEEKQKLPYLAIMGAKSYLDLMLASLIRHPSMKEVVSEYGYEYINQSLPYADAPLDIKLWTVSDAVKSEILKEGLSGLLEEDLKNSSTKKDEELSQKIQSTLLFKYPHTDLEGLTVKTTVSDLKHAGYEEAVEEAKELFKEESFADDSEKETYLPRFKRQEEAILGTQFGSAMHKVMELLSFSEKYLINEEGEEVQKKIYGMIKGEVDYWIEKDMVDIEEIKPANLWKIAGFFLSDLGKRMIKANLRHELYREQPFVIGLPASYMNENLSKAETVLVQGVIDGFFYEEDKIILMDYKTDKVQTGEELIKRYKTQLDYYERALTQITGKKVLERKIYAFGLEKEIDL